MMQDKITNVLIVGVGGQGPYLPAASLHRWLYRWDMMSKYLKFMVWHSVVAA